jgi:uncharacterized protein (DUF58 family)
VKIPRWQTEWTVALGGLVLSGLGWWAHSGLLAIGGLLIAATVTGLWLWQLHCLDSVSVRRRLQSGRALFGEEITLEMEMVNDKLIPLTWLHVQVEVPTRLQIKGAAIRQAADGRRDDMHLLLPMLPYQRVVRRMTVVCSERGEHTFGRSLVESGDPLCLRRRQKRINETNRLLVYPKVLKLDTPSVIGRLALGERRGDPRLAGDPSRVAGVRDYRPGDPLRHVDWRASARASTLLVREHEPSSTLRLAVFADLRTPPDRRAAEAADPLELAVALTASLVMDLAGTKVPTGLYSSGTVGGRPVIHRSGGGPDALAAMLESLAVLSLQGRMGLDDLLSAEVARLGSGSSVLVVALDFNETLSVALASARRRVPVVALWVNAGFGAPPPAGIADSSEEVRYDAGWRERDIVEMVS